MAIKGGWTSLDQVPLLAWFRLKSNPKDVFPIQQINLQHLNSAYVPGAPPPKASPAVKINEQFWRPEELSAAFEVSLDGLTWQDCAGDLFGGRGPLADRVAKIESALQSHSKLSRETADALAKQIETATAQADQLAGLKASVESLQKWATNAANVIDSHSSGLERLLRPTTEAAEPTSEKSPAGNSAQGSEPPKDPPKANPGAKPPEPKK